jgi:hypothetical protein
MVGLMDILLSREEYSGLKFKKYSFLNVRKSAELLLISLSPCVRQNPWNNSRTPGQILMVLEYEEFDEIRVLLSYYSSHFDRRRLTTTVDENLLALLRMSRQIFTKAETCPTKVVENNEIHTSCPVHFLRTSFSIRDN